MNNDEVKPEEQVKAPEEAPKAPQPMPEGIANAMPMGNRPPMREIIIQTDGTSIKITKSQAAGKIELIAILEEMAKFLRSQ